MNSSSSHPSPARASRRSPRRIHARCCNRSRFGRFCSECGKALVADDNRKVRIVLVQPDGKRIPFDSIDAAVKESKLTRRQIDWAMLGNQRPDGTKWEKAVAA